MKNQIEIELKNLNANLNEENKLQYQSLQDQLNEIIENEVKGVILRSLCNDYEKGEKCTKYFFSLEKYKAKQAILQIFLKKGLNYNIIKLDPEWLAIVKNIFYI